MNSEETSAASEASVATPRTDAFCITEAANWKNGWADFARTLEREVSAYQRALKNMDRDYERMVVINARESAELASLRSSHGQLEERVKELEGVIREYLRVHDSKGGEDYDGSIYPMRQALRHPKTET